MSKFTKGPWKAYKMGPLTPQLTYRIFALNEAETVCDLSCEYAVIKSDEENESNAHLISAAPEMYEALESIKSMLSSINSPEDERMIVNVINSVLKKARGEG